MNNKKSKLILIEGLPGTGKSSIMDELAKKHFIVYEFHTKRKKITKQFGAFNKGKRIALGNKRVKALEDKLENIILNLRFMNPDKEGIKLKLLNEKMNECLSLNSDLILKEGFLGCLIDKNSADFLKAIEKLLLNADAIVFLKLSDKELSKRQRQRLKTRKGEYDDTTSRMRHEIYINQFKKITKGKRIIYLDAKPSIKIIVKNLAKKLKNISMQP